MTHIHPLVAATGSTPFQLWAIGVAGVVVYARGPGREAWRRARDRRLHPARLARFTAVIMTVVAGAVIVTGMAATTKPRPVRPRAVVATVVDLDRAERRASFVLYDPVPGGADQLSPDALSGASY
jgi:hypothetical protein